MWLNRIVLVIALLISAAAAFYSITGLTHIFTGATVAVLIMGLVLEAGKVSVAAWLHKYWKEGSAFLKTYLVIAVVVLMMITSMGTFGFLSKAHLESTSDTAVATEQVRIYDEQLETINQDLERIDSAIGQLDQIVAGAGTRAVRVRSGQRSERTELAAERTELLAQRVEITGKRSGDRTAVVSAEAELGPIKYIAEMIYGEDADEASFDKAVRWMIILLVVVFDPLAIAMLVAAQSGFHIEANRKKLIAHKSKQPEMEAGYYYAPYIPVISPNVMPESLPEDSEVQQDTEKAESIQEVPEPIEEEIAEVEEGWLSNVKSLRRGSPTVETL